MSSNPAAHPFASASLYVGDLNSDVTEAMLYEVFNSVGPVASIRVCRDSVTRRSLGYAYVNYHSATDAERALDTLNYTTIKTAAVRIMWCHRDPSLRKSGAGNIFVKNLDKNIDNKALYDTFSLFGNILSCKVATDDSGRSLGFGFVHYEVEESAKSAIDRVNGMQIGSKTVYVGPFIRKTDRTSQREERFTNLYIKNIPTEWTDNVLDKVFTPFGEITSRVLKQDKKGRMFAFVNYHSSDSARNAVEALDGRQTSIDGLMEGDAEEEKEEDDEDAIPPNRIYVGRAQTKGERVAMLKEQYAGSAEPKHSRYTQGVNLYIKNLDDSVDDEKLREVFDQFGSITSVKVMRDEKNQSRGFGFVCFMSPDEATKAVTDMHLKLMLGKPLYVGLAEKREQRVARLQQRYRVPNMRPMPGGVAPQHLFTAPPPVYFSPGVHVPRPVMFGHNMMPWRAPSPRGPYQQQGVPMPPQVAATMRPMYPMVPAGPMGGPTAVNMAGVRGPRGPRSAVQPGGAKQPPPIVAKQQNFKFTPQARNRIDHQQSPQQQMSDSTLLVSPDTPLTAAALAGAAPNMQKQLLGEKLFPQISRYQPELAGKITGMMLEMENAELLMLLESEGQLKSKVDEALRVLQQAQATPDHE